MGTHSIHSSAVNMNNTNPVSAREGRWLGGGGGGGGGGRSVGACVSLCVCVCVPPDEQNPTQ